MHFAAAPGSRLTTGQRVIVRGRRWTIGDTRQGSNCQALRLLCDDPGAATRERTLLLPFDRPQPLEERTAPRVVRPRRWLHALRRFAAGLEPPGGLVAAAASDIRLMPYQLEPALAVLRYGATRLLIADAVGLGKTIEAGLLLLELQRHLPAFRAIVLTPAGLKEQWTRELGERFGLGSVRADAAWLAAWAREQPADLNPWDLPGIHVASQDFVKRAEVLGPLEDVIWDVCVIDEAHAVTLRSDRRAAADSVARRSRRVVLLTATPHDGNPAEFESLCRLGRIDRDPILLFRRSRAEAGRAERRRSTILPVRLSAAERRMHDLLERYTRCVWRESAARGDDRARLATIVLRKRALSSAAALAASARRRTGLLAARGDAGPSQLALPLADEDALDDEEPSAVLAAPGLSDSRRERSWLAAIAEAAQHAAREESKTRRLVRLLLRLREPAIVFTEFRDTLVRLQRAVAPTGPPVLLLHGGMSPAERSRVHRTFNTEPAVLLATDAASEGLNLHTRCRVVVHYELPWSPDRLEQRTGRVDRVGQRQRVHEIALVAADTAERLVLAPLILRNARTKDGSNALVRSLSESRVARLVMGDASPSSAEVGGPTEGVFITTNLAEEARREAERLLAARRLHAISPPPKRPSRKASGPVLARLRRKVATLRAGCIYVYGIRVRARDGRMVARTATVLTADAIPAGPVGRGARIVRECAVAALPEDLSAELLRAIRAAVDDATAVHHRVRQGLRAREEAIRRPHASVARRLVQAGLFDRRAVRLAEMREARDRLLAEDAEAELGELAADSPLAVDVTLAAALLVDPRGRRR